MRWLLLLLLASSCRVLTDRSLPEPINLHDITFYKNRGWIVSYGTGHVFQTKNEGKNWKLVSKLDSIYFEKIQFIDNKTGWLAGERSTLLKTIDGGQHWQKLVVDTVNTNLLFYSMYWQDERNGWLSGQKRSETQVQNYIYKTINGGVSWARDEAPSLFFNLIRQKSLTWWASATDKIYKSTNGIDWIESFSDSLKNSGQLRGLTVVDEHNVLATGFKGTLVRSSNGGQVWQVQKVSMNRLRQVQSPNATTILLAGDKTADNNNVLISFDSGRSWKALEVKGDVHRMVIHKSQVWLVGKNGLVLGYRKGRMRKAKF